VIPITVLGLTIPGPLVVPDLCNQLVPKPPWLLPVFESPCVGGTFAVYRSLLKLARLNPPAFDLGMGFLTLALDPTDESGDTFALGFAGGVTRTRVHTPASCPASDRQKAPVVPSNMWIWELAIPMTR